MGSAKQKLSPRAAAGFARAANMSAEERSISASIAAQARWTPRARRKRSQQFREMWAYQRYLESLESA
jgi:hypothetical protein